MISYVLILCGFVQICIGLHLWKPEKVTQIQYQILGADGVVVYGAKFFEKYRIVEPEEKP